MTSKTYKEREMKERLIQEFTEKHRKLIFSNNIQHDTTKKQRRRIKLKRRRLLKKRVKKYKQTTMKEIRYGNSINTPSMEDHKKKQSIKPERSPQLRSQQEVNHLSPRRDL